MADPLTDAFGSHYHDVYRYIRSRVGDDAAEDIAQDTFLTVARSATLRQALPDAARPVLFGVATRLIRGFWRAESRRHDAIERVAHRDHRPDTSEADDADGRLDAMALGPHISRALTGLSEGEREVVLLFALAELGHREIASALRISTVAARVRLMRGRRKLRALLSSDAMQQHANQGQRLIEGRS
ncbi:RNA polymerase sigma factor [Dactylosporangium sp. CA-092794]|uniref:RNA polymerase sigma factor n=1 Tax=Dactylosporangium sp. CA-092794 TaxID=3239929 RepID=UPI003D92C1AA